MQMDTERINRIFEENYSGLCRFLEGLLGDGSAAEDIAQEVFLRLLRVGIDTVGEGEERFWIYRVARNLALNEIARLRTMRRVHAQFPRVRRPRPPRTPVEEAEAREIQGELARRIRELPESQKAALLLRELGQLTFREIARVLGVSEGKVKADIFRARESLRRPAARSSRAEPTR